MRLRHSFFFFLSSLCGEVGGGLGSLNSSYIFRVECTCRIMMDVRGICSLVSEQLVAVILSVSYRCTHLKFLFFFLNARQHRYNNHAIINNSLEQQRKLKEEAYRHRLLNVKFFFFFPLFVQLTFLFSKCI